MIKARYFSHSRRFTPCRRDFVQTLTGVEFFICWQAEHMLEPANPGNRTLNRHLSFVQGVVSRSAPAESNPLNCWDHRVCNDSWAWRSVIRPSSMQPEAIM